MKTLEKVILLWRERCCDYFDEAFLSLKFNYAGQEHRAIDIASALALGKFIQNDLWISPHHLKWETCNEFLTQFVNDENNHLATVAMMGSMPNRLFRRVLWEYNIDFSTPEALLRRITSEQTQAVRDNYNDLINGIVPRAFSSWQRFSEKVDPESLFSENDRDFREYENKGAWAYNLGNLDWGFNLYPNGANDDTQTPKINPFNAVAKFVSIKGDKEQFVVNDFDGKYWKLYKSARSSRGWFPNRNVTIGKYICPGFWNTLLIHFLFWIASPISAMLCMFLWQNSTTLWLTIPTTTVGVIMPVWIISAVIMTIVKYLASVINKYLDYEFIDKVSSKVPKPIREAVLYTAEGVNTFVEVIKQSSNDKIKDILSWMDNKWDSMVIISKTICWLIVLPSGILAYKSIIGPAIYIFGVFDAHLILIGICLYVRYRATKNKFRMEVSEFPTWIRIWLATVSAVLFLYFMTMYGQWMLAVVTYNLVTTITFIGSSLFVVSAVFVPAFLAVEKMSEKQYLIIEKWTFIVAASIFATGFVYVFIQALSDPAMLQALILSLVIGIFAIAILYHMTKWFFEPNVIKSKQFTSNRFWWSFSASKNQWLMSLSEHDVRDAMRSIRGMVNQVFTAAHYEYSIDDILQYITPKAIHTINENIDFWRHCFVDEGLSKEDILRAFRLISMDDMSSEGAYTVVKKEHDKKEKRLAMLKKFFKVVLFPVWGIVLVILWIFVQIGRAKELYQLYNFFSNKICPHAEERIRVRF